MWRTTESDFETIPDICDIRPSSDESHTHIGLRNLDRRLYLLFGEMAHLEDNKHVERMHHNFF